MQIRIVPSELKTRASESLDVADDLQQPDKTLAQLLEQTEQDEENQETNR